MAESKPDRDPRYTQHTGRGLRPYQTEALAKVRDALRPDGEPVAVVVPAGAGKTGEGEAD